MSVSIISFFPAQGSGPLSDDQLKAALKTAKDLAPAGSKVEVRALDDTYLEIDYPTPGSEPTVARAGMYGELPKPYAPAIVTIWFDDALDNLELKVQETAKALHGALKARGTGTFDTRCHLDLTNGGPPPKLQAVIVINRRTTLDRDQFIQYYRTHHVPLAKSLGPKFTRYTTFRLLEAEGDFTADCVTFQEYPSYDEIVAHMNNRVRSDDTAHNDVGNFNQHIVYNIGERTFV